MVWNYTITYQCVPLHRLGETLAIPVSPGGLHRICGHPCAKLVNCVYCSQNGKWNQIQIWEKPKKVFLQTIIDRVSEAEGWLLCTCRQDWWAEMRYGHYRAERMPSPYLSVCGEFAALERPYINDNGKRVFSVSHIIYARSCFNTSGEKLRNKDRYHENSLALLYGSVWLLQSSIVLIGP